MHEFEQIKAEALQIAQIASRLRRARPAGPMWTTAGVITAAELLAAPFPPRGEPRPSDPAEQAFDESIRFWARRAAGQITLEQWDEMVWFVTDQVPDFPGNVVSFFERQFELLKLADGTIVLH